MTVTQPAGNPWTPPPLASGGPARWIGANLAVALLYYLMAVVVSRFFASYGLFPAPIWLPTSVAAIAGMIGGTRMLPGIFLGSFAANHILFAAAMHISIIISLTNAVGPVVAATLLRRLRPGRGLFTSFAGVVAFIACMTGLSPAISALGGAVALTIGKPVDPTAFYQILVTWWLTDSGGTLYLTPALILWLRLEREPAVTAASPGPNRREAIAWAIIAAVTLAVFLTPPLQRPDIRTALPFLLTVPLSWIALRMSLRSAYTLVSLTALIACVGTVAGFGPFQAGAGGINPLQLVGTLVVLLAMNVLTIVALVSERREAEAASQVKSMFLANTSHELRTPLTAIIGYSSMIGGGEDARSRKHAEFARHIGDSGKHLLALINGLLDISRIEAGRFDLHEEPVALRDALDEAMSVVRGQALEKSIALDSGMPGGDMAVLADARALRQILVNLLSNAVKFTPDGGRVDLNAGKLADGRLFIRVHDTGSGIPPDSLERVFAPFERARDGKNDTMEGTGLGLSITRGLVELHGGTITLESELGKGTLATVILPASRIVETLPAKG